MRATRIRRRNQSTGGHRPRRRGIIPRRIASKVPAVPTRTPDMAKKHRRRAAHGRSARTRLSPEAVESKAQENLSGGRYREAIAGFKELLKRLTARFGQDMEWVSCSELAEAVLDLSFR